MNIHPIFVHIPVAFLSVYGLAELVRFKIFAERLHWFYVKAALLIVGVGGAVMALVTGDMAEGLWRDNTAKRQLIEIHSTYAAITFVVAGLLAVLYAVALVDRQQWLRLPEGSGLRRIWTQLARASNTIISSPWVSMWALAVFVLITIVGALGGSIVYGPDTDPVVKFIYGIVVNS